MFFVWCESKVAKCDTIRVCTEISFRLVSVKRFAKFRIISEVLNNSQTVPLKMCNFADFKNLKLHKFYKFLFVRNLPKRYFPELTEFVPKFRETLLTETSRNLKNS